MDANIAFRAILGHHTGLLASVDDSIRRMQAKGIHLSPRLIQMTREAAQESRA